MLFTHEVYEKFQEEVLAARDHCDVQDTTLLGDGIKRRQSKGALQVQDLQASCVS